MSFAAVLAVLRWSRARPTVRLVHLVLATHADKATGEAWPAIKTLAHETGLSERAVWGALRELEDAGAIIQIAPGGGRGHTTRYRLALAGKGAGDATFVRQETSHLTPQTSHLTTVKHARRATEVKEKGKEPRASAAAYAAPPGAGPCRDCGAIAELELGRCASCYQAFEDSIDWTSGAA